MRATCICLDVVETVRQTVVHCTKVFSQANVALNDNRKQSLPVHFEDKLRLFVSKNKYLFI